MSGWYTHASRELFGEDRGFIEMVAGVARRNQQLLAVPNSDTGRPGFVFCLEALDKPAGARRRSVSINRRQVRVCGAQACRFRQMDRLQFLERDE
jgi:hypothetical protein